MPVKISILTDNRSRAPRYACEHGLSVYMQTPQANLLLDTGQTDLLLRNARMMNIDLGLSDFVVLSHGHYDHVGGLPSLVDAGLRATVVAHPDVTRRRYSSSSIMLKPNGFPRPEALASANVLYIDRPTDIAEGITVFPLPSDAPANPRLLVDAPDGTLVPDRFPDELFTLVRDGETTILYAGCTHHGLPQLLSFVRNNLGIEQLSMFVGGLHLRGRDTAEIEAVADAVEPFGVEQWIVNHCSGDEAATIWQKRFGAKPENGFAGSAITI